MVEHSLPADIERTSMAIITKELAERGISLPPEQEAVVRRVIHTTADFDYAENLTFTENAVARGVAAMAAGPVIVTDTNMARAGISKPALAKLGGEALCFMADPEIAEAAKAAGTTEEIYLSLSDKVIHQRCLVHIHKSLFTDLVKALYSYRVLHNQAFFLFLPQRYIINFISPKKNTDFHILRISCCKITAFFLFLQ